MNVKKQDRQGVRTPADLERKYELNLIGKGSGGGGASGDIASLAADLVSLSEYTYSKLEELGNGKADKSGWTPDKFLGTDERGNIVEKDAPISDDSDNTSIVLKDQSTGTIYNLFMSNGDLMFEESTEQTLPSSKGATLIDSTTGKEYKLYVSNGKLMLAESEV